MPERARVETVDGYLSALPEGVRTTLEEIRQTIRAAAPNATEEIRFQMPTFVQDGPLVGLAASKNHLSLHFFGYLSQEILQLIKDAGRGDLGKGCIRFSADNPLPPGLVRQLVEVRLRENAAAASKRGLKPSSQSPKKEQV